MVASDSSSVKEAAVCCHLSESAVMELQKHALQKGLWNRLLSPGKAYLKQKALLDEDDELAFEEIAATQQFKPFGKVRLRKSRQHINLGEISAALEAERLMGEREPDHFYLHMQDSQVSLAALVKGRSSSKAVNDLIRGSIPFHVESGIRPFCNEGTSAEQFLLQTRRKPNDGFLRPTSLSRVDLVEDTHKSPPALKN